MDQVRLAPLVGIGAAIVVLLLLAGPYMLVEPASAIGTYYGTGAITPLLAGLFALLSIVIFAAGRQDRTDPALAAGATLVMGVFALVIALAWALTVPRSVVTQMSTAQIIVYHRAALVLGTLGLPLAAGWYARTMRLL